MWNTIVDNLCLYEHQNMDGLLRCPVRRVIALNDGAIRKAKIIRSVWKKGHRK